MDQTDDTNFSSKGKIKRSRSLDNLENHDYSKKISKLKTFLYDDLICTICQSRLILPCTLSCAHSFCFECLEKLHKTQHPDYGNGMCVENYTDEKSDCDSHIDSGEGDSGVSDSSDEENNKESIDVDKDEIEKDEIEKDEIDKDDKFGENLIKEGEVFETVQDITSEILRGNLKYLKWVDCEDCDIVCPNCKRTSSPFPKLNILLHNILFHMFPDEYTSHVNEIAEDIVLKNIIKIYENTDRYKTLYEMITGTVKNLEIEGMMIEELVHTFSDYESIEVIWGLYKYHQIDDFNTFLILEDRIILIECIKDYIEAHITKESFKNLLILTSWICGDDDIFDLIDETYGVPSGIHGKKFQNEELMLTIFKRLNLFNKFVTSHSFV